jgi:MFS transporter, ACS family, glucarate transporter
VAGLLPPHVRQRGGTLGWAMVADLAPRNQMEFTGSLVNAVGNASGIVTPVLIGTLVARTGHFDAALVAAALHGVAALVIHAWVIGPLARMPPL